MPFILVTSQTAIARNAAALYGVTAGTTEMASFVTQATSQGIAAFLNNVYAASVGTASTTTVANELIANLGITGTDAIDVARAYIVGKLNVDAGAGRGVIVNDILSLFSGLTADATYGAAATAWNTQVTNAETYSTTAGNLRGSIATISTTVTVAAQTFTLTTGVDILTGSAGNDVFTAAEVATVKAWTVGDAINGGLGTDVFNVIQTADITVPTGATVTGIETMNATSGGVVTLTTSTGFTGLTALNTTGVGAATLTGAATTAISSTTSALAAGAVAVNGGSTATVTATGQTTGTITVGAATAAAGAVSVTTTGVYADGTDSALGAITVTGGSTVSVTVNSGLTAAQITAQTTDTSNNTLTLSAVTVTGNASTTAVTVAQATSVVEVDTATIGLIGITGGGVTIADVNAASATAAGTITTVTLSNFGNVSAAVSTVNSGALTTLNLSGKAFGAGLTVTTGALTTATVTTQALNLTGFATGTGAGVITLDSDITTLNIASATTASTIKSLVAAGATTVNVSGDILLTLTGQTLTAVTAINVTNTAGASFGTLLGTAVTFTGGAGVDTITIGATTKAITMGAGNDVVTATGLVGTGGSVAAGDGTDTIVMTFAQADAADASSTFNTKFTGFETLRLSDAITAAIDVDGINAATQVTLVLGSNGGTVSNLVSGGTVLVQANNAGTLAVGIKSAVVAATDVLNLNLSKATALTGNTVTVANVETINIGMADAVTAGSVADTHTLTLAATSATTVTVTGNNGLTLTNTNNAAITTFDASGVVANSTAATATVVATADAASKLAVTFASANVTASASVTIKGGAGDDTLTGTVAKDTITGGAGIDTIYSDNAGTKAVAKFTVIAAATTTASDIVGATIVLNLFGIDVTTTFAATDDTAAEQATAIVTAINLSAAVNKLVVATVSSATITLTSTVDGAAFNVDATAGTASGITIKSGGTAVDTAMTLADGADASAVVQTVSTSAVAVNEILASGSVAGVAGTTAVDSIDGGAGVDIIVGGGGADTLTGGTGIDTFFMLQAHSVLAALAIITDFTFAVGGASNDRIIIGDVTTVIGTTATVQDLSASASLAAAMGAAALTNTVNLGLSVFIFGGNEYAFVETTGSTATYVATDFVVQLTGLPLAAGATIAGSGFDAV